MVEFGMTVQQATEAANFNTNQLWLSLGGSKLSDRIPRAGNILLPRNASEELKTNLKKMGYQISLGDRTSGPINAIYFDWKHGSLWGGSSNNGEDYGIGW
jgi:gamma-glutamyltranspeptidase/glutathione hydrolase